MKKYITQAAIDKVVEEYKLLSRCANCTSGHQHTLYLERIVTLVEVFAILTGQEWINAETMLRKRASN